jgi:hypothetical protein
MMGTLRSLAIMCVLAAPALAQPKGSPQVTPNAMQVASDLVKKAIAKSQAGDHSGAIDLYLQAYQLSPQHALLSNVANEYLEMKKSYEALKYFCMYLEKDPTGTNATYVTSKAKSIEIEMGNSDVTDATVCKPKVKKDPKETPPKDEPKKEPITTPTTGSVETGSDSGKGMRYAGLGIAGAGAIAIGLGAYFGLQAKKIADDITHHCDGFPPNMCPAWDNNIKQIEEEGRSDNTKFIVLTIAGGAAIITGTALFIVGRKKPSEQNRVTFTPVATGDTVGFVLDGRF